MIAKFRRSWKMLQEDMNAGAQRQNDRSKKLKWLGNYKVILGMKDPEKRENELDWTMFFLEKPYRKTPSLFKAMNPKDLKTHPVLQKIYNSNIMAMQNLENRMQRESLSEYVELEKELFQNKFREKLEEIEDQKQRELEALEGDYLLKLPRAYSGILGPAVGYYEKLPQFEEEPELKEEDVMSQFVPKVESGKTKAEETFSLEDAMRILGIQNKPTEEELEERFNQVFTLNDPDKGGSFHLQEIARTAKDGIERAMNTPNFVWPENVKG